MVKFGIFKKKSKGCDAALSPAANTKTAESVVGIHIDPPSASMIATSNSTSKSRRCDEETARDELSENREDDDNTAFETTVSAEEDTHYGSDYEESVPSYDEETYDETYDGTIIHNDISYDGSLAAMDAVGDTKKFFHKDVVLHNIGENQNGNGLVIRAMYFVPKPKTEDDIVVRIEASTVSARDVMHCRGVGLSRSMLPFVPGYEVIGTVQTLGENAKAEGLFKEGDRVAGLSLCGGGNSRFISISGSRLVKISDSVKSTQAVCLIHDYMAALKALRLAKKSGSPFTGMNILLTDGFSPIGQAVINLAAMEGANIYCCADENKHSYLASLGAKCFSKEPEAWLPSASGSFDVVIDNSCTDSYSSSWFALNQKGTLVCLSPVFSFDRNYEGGCGIIDFTELQQKWAGLKAKYMMPNTYFFDTIRDFDNDREQYLQDLRYLTFLLEKGNIKPKIAEKVSLEDVPDAQRLMIAGRANGTIVCVPWIDN